MKSVIVLLADGFEEVEAVTPIDILRRGEVKVTVLGVTGRTVTGSRNIVVEADMELCEYHNDPDAVIIPGGLPGATNIASSRKAVEIIKRIYAEGGLVSAICAAPAKVLAPLGILRDKNATCYPGLENELTMKGASFSDAPVVKDGNIITSRAVGTALQFSLEILAYLQGEEIAEKVKTAVLFHSCCTDT